MSHIGQQVHSRQECAWACACVSAWTCACLCTCSHYNSLFWEVQRNRESVSFWLGHTSHSGWTPCPASSTLKKMSTLFSLVFSQSFLTNKWIPFVKCAKKNGCGGQKCQYLPKQVSTLFACFSRQEVKVSRMLPWYALFHINELSLMTETQNSIACWHCIYRALCATNFCRLHMLHCLLHERL